MGSQHFQPSEDAELKELPQYTGEHENKSKVMVVPSVRKLPHKEHDTGNLLSLLSTPIDCKLTLGELLKIRPHLWNELAGILGKMGIREIKSEDINQLQ